MNKILKTKILLIIAILLATPLSLFTVSKTAIAEGGCVEGFSVYATNNRTSVSSVDTHIGYGNNTTVYGQPGDSFSFELYIDTYGFEFYQTPVADVATNSGSAPAGVFTKYFGVTPPPSINHLDFRSTPPINSPNYSSGWLKADFTLGSFDDYIDLTAACDEPTGGNPEHNPVPAWAQIVFAADTPTPDFSLSCMPASTTIAAGSPTSYNLTTTAQNGFNSPITFSPATILPNAANPPSINYTGNGQTPTPNATTVANVTTTSSTTLAPPSAPYRLNFTATGGGKTHSCITELAVTPGAPHFTLSIAPNTTNSIKGNTVSYTVTSTCATGFSGPINLAAASLFTGLTYTFKRGETTIVSMNCADSVTLVVGNTGALPPNQLSTPQTRLGKTITVTGTEN